MAEQPDRQVIIPKFKIIVAYDVRSAEQEGYYQFILGEFVPALQEMGVYMTEAWHTAYGEYPLRMISFVAEDYAVIEELFDSMEWGELEGKLRSLVMNYSLKVVQYRPGFQFTRN